MPVNHEGSPSAKMASETPEFRSRAFPRAALVGNPSDGYFGKTIAFTFSNFAVDALLIADAAEALPAGYTAICSDDIAKIRDIDVMSLTEDQIPILMATAKQFAMYCLRHNIDVENRPFTFGFKSTIPINVGLAGSSAIVLACYRTLMQYCRVEIPLAELANEVLKVETEHLGIAAGLQDRVTQAYQGMVYMDFDQSLMANQGYGRYERLDTECFPGLYIAFKRDLSESSNVIHSNLRQRWEQGDRVLIDAMHDCASCAEAAYLAINAGNFGRLAAYINKGFEQRQRAIKSGKENLDMINIARSVGASANQAGSGRAIVGTFGDRDMYLHLQRKAAEEGVEVICPVIAMPTNS